VVVPAIALSVTFPILIPLGFYEVGIILPGFNCWGIVLE